MARPEEQLAMDASAARNATRFVGTVVCRRTLRSEAHRGAHGPFRTSAPLENVRREVAHWARSQFQSGDVTDQEVGRWVELSPADARRALVTYLAIDPARRVEVMAVWDAERFVDRFFAMFDPAARFFTLSAGAALAFCAFDGGVAVVDDNHLGILWLCSNDRDQPLGG